jgi:competence protein ComEA
MVLLLFISTIIIIVGVIMWINYDPGEEITITATAANEWEGNIYIGGAVGMPGFYPCKKEDCIESLLNAAGGLSIGAEISSLTLIANDQEMQYTSQKIDINRAEPWLLQALQGIGEVLAERIYDYRIRNGPFSTTSELMEIEGIGQTVYDTIKPFITVSD